MRRETRWRFVEAAINEYGLAASHLCRRDIPPTAANHITRRKIDAEFLRRIDRKPRFGLGCDNGSCRHRYDD